MASVMCQNLTPSAKRQRKTPAQTLIRVRNNQRRHRAQRREYISSLEQKLQQTESLLAQSEANVASLKADLEIWKYRNNGGGPHSAGSTGSTFVGDNTSDAPTSFPVEWQSSEAEQQPDSRGDALRETSPLATYSEPAAETALLTAFVSPDLTPTMSTATDGSMTDESVSTLSIVPSRRESPTSVAVHPVSPVDNVPSGLPPRCCSPVKDPSILAFKGIALSSSSALESPDLTILPSACLTYPPSDSESTTLCNQANILIAQQNFRGLNADMIGSWLCQGFRRAKAHDEGCRVENQLLFGLLDFISSA